MNLDSTASPSIETTVQFVAGMLLRTHQPREQAMKKSTTMTVEVESFEDADWREWAQHALKRIPTTPDDYAKSRASDFRSRWADVIAPAMSSGGFRFSAQARQRLDRMAADLADAIEAERGVVFDMDARATEKRLVNRLYHLHDDLH